MLKREIIQTADGSHTLFLPGWGEYYHSAHGAISESMHVFIREGFDHLVGVKGTEETVSLVPDQPRQLHILEVGFGTGLNALLTLERATRYHVRVHYTAIEPFPLTEGEVSRLNHPAMVAGGALSDEFSRMHTAPLEKATKISPQFTLYKTALPLQQVQLSAGTIHLVYHDAFAPRFQPELWEHEVFSRLSDAMQPGGILTTYSAGGKVKRALRLAGLILSHPPGAAGKREMTRAVKPGSTHIVEQGNR